LKGFHRQPRSSMKRHIVVIVFKGTYGATELNAEDRHPGKRFVILT
jgi:hypothetical protein